MVRLFDSLGPQFVTGTTQPIADALQARGSVAGDVVAVEALLGRYGTVSPEVKAVLKRIGAAPPLQRFAYRTADQLDPP
jgi:hypothetical protein